MRRKRGAGASACQLLIRALNGWQAGYPLGPPAPPTTLARRCTLGGDYSESMNPVPRWRIAAAVLVLAALLGFGAMFAPIYVDNLKLQTYVEEITRRVDSQNQ